MSPDSQECGGNRLTGAGAGSEPVEEPELAADQGVVVVLKSGCDVVWCRDPLRAAAFIQKASLRRRRRSRPSPLLRLALWKNASPRYQFGFINRLLQMNKVTAYGKCN
jgi:hypothetical protein